MFFIVRKLNVCRFKRQQGFHILYGRKDYYYFFDEMNDTEIGDNLFINKKTLLQVCRKKLKTDKSISFPIKNLSQYKINTNTAGNITGIDLSK